MDSWSNDHHYHHHHGLTIIYHHRNVVVDNIFERRKEKNWKNLIRKNLRHQFCDCHQS